ncbi:MAG TPA: MFS transporter [Gaiellaceae bacterium]|nr:MFS transporter [Gaiellaceae bacterium]
MTNDARPARYSDVFRIAEFRALYASYVISMLGDVIAAVALTVLVYERTGSSALAAATFSISFVPYLLGGALLGAVVDRLPSRSVLVGCSLLSTAIVGVMALPVVPVPVLFALLIVLSLIAPVFSAVRAATLPDVLRETSSFVLGRSLLRLSAQLTQVVGNAVGGLLLIVLSPHGALAVDAASFLSSALLIRFGTNDRPAKVITSEQSMLSDSLHSIRSLMTHPLLRRLFLFGWLLPTCTVAPEALAAPYTHEIGRPASAVGLFLVGLPAGTALSDLLVARLLRLRIQARLIVPGALLTCLPLLIFLSKPGLPVSIFVLFVTGLGCAYMPGFDQRLVATTDDDNRARALAAYTAGLIGFQGIGFILWGVVAEFASPRYVIAAAALCALLVVINFRPRQSA